MVAIVIGVACIYQLAFTWVTRNQEGKARDYAEATVAAAAQNPDFSADDPLNRTFRLIPCIAQAKSATSTP